MKIFFLIAVEVPTLHEGIAIHPVMDTVFIPFFFVVMIR